jgi:hypothetical protein
MFTTVFPVPRPVHAWYSETPIKIPLNPNFFPKRILLPCFIKQVKTGFFWLNTVAPGYPKPLPKMISHVPYHSESLQAHTISVTPQREASDLMNDSIL